MDAVHANAELRDLGRDIARKCLDRQFAWSVVSTSRKNPGGLNGADIYDDAASSGCRCVPAEDLRTHPSAPQIDHGDSFPLLVGHFEKGDNRLNAGVVHKYVDSAHLAPGAFEHRFDLLP